MAKSSFSVSFRRGSKTKTIKSSKGTRVVSRSSSGSSSRSSSKSTKKSSVGIGKDGVSSEEAAKLKARSDLIFAGKEVPKNLQIAADTKKLNIVSDGKRFSTGRSGTSSARIGRGGVSSSEAAKLKARNDLIRAGKPIPKNLQISSDTKKLNIVSDGRRFSTGRREKSSSDKRIKDKTIIPLSQRIEKRIITSPLEQASQKLSLKQQRRDLSVIKPTSKELAVATKQFKDGVGDTALGATKIPGNIIKFGYNLLIGNPVAYGRYVKKESDETGLPMSRIVTQDLNKISSVTGKIATFVVKHPVASTLIIGSFVNEVIKSEHERFIANPVLYVIEEGVETLVGANVLKGLGKISNGLDNINLAKKTTSANQKIVNDLEKKINVRDRTPEAKELMKLKEAVKLEDMDLKKLNKKLFDAPKPKTTSQFNKLSSEIKVESKKIKNKVAKTRDKAKELAEFEKGRKKQVGVDGALSKPEKEKLFSELDKLNEIFTNNLKGFKKLPSGKKKIVKIPEKELDKLQKQRNNIFKKFEKSTTQLKTPELKKLQKARIIRVDPLNQIVEIKPSKKTKVGLKITSKSDKKQLKKIKNRITNINNQLERNKLNKNHKNYLKLTDKERKNLLSEEIDLKRFIEIDPFAKKVIQETKQQLDNTKKIILKFEVDSLKKTTDSLTSFKKTKRNLEVALSETKKLTFKNVEKLKEDFKKIFQKENILKIKKLDVNQLKNQLDKISDKFTKINKLILADKRGDIFIEFNDLKNLKIQKQTLLTQEKRISSKLKLIDLVKKSNSEIEKELKNKIGLHLKEILLNQQTHTKEIITKLDGIKKDIVEFNKKSTKEKISKLLESPRGKNTIIQLKKEIGVIQEKIRDGKNKFKIIKQISKVDATKNLGLSPIKFEPLEAEITRLEKLIKSLSEKFQKKNLDKFSIPIKKSGLTSKTSPKGGRVTIDVKKEVIENIFIGPTKFRLVEPSKLKKVKAFVIKTNKNGMTMKTPIGDIEIILKKQTRSLKTSKRGGIHSPLSAISVKFTPKTKTFEVHKTKVQKILSDRGKQGVRDPRYLNSLKKSVSLDNLQKDLNKNFHKSNIKLRSTMKKQLDLIERAIISQIKLRELIVLRLTLKAFALDTKQAQQLTQVLEQIHEPIKELDLEQISELIKETKIDIPKSPKPPKKPTPRKLPPKKPKEPPKDPPKKPTPRKLPPKKPTPPKEPPEKPKILPKIDIDLDSPKLKNKVVTATGTYRERINPNKPASKQNKVIEKSIKITDTPNRIKKKLGDLADRKAIRTIMPKVLAVSNKKKKDIKRPGVLKKFTKNKKGALVEKSKYALDKKSEQRELRTLKAIKKTTTPKKSTQKKKTTNSKKKSVKKKVVKKTPVKKSNTKKVVKVNFKTNSGKKVSFKGKKKTTKKKSKPLKNKKTNKKVSKGKKK